MAGTSLAGTTADYYIYMSMEGGISSEDVIGDAANIFVGGDRTDGQNCGLFRGWFEFNTAIAEQARLTNTKLHIYNAVYAVAGGMDAVDKVAYKLGTTDDAFIPAEDVNWTLYPGDLDVGTIQRTSVGWWEDVIDGDGTLLNYGGHTYIRIVRCEEGDSNTTGKWKFKAADAPQRNPYIEGTYSYIAGVPPSEDAIPHGAVVRIPAVSSTERKSVGRAGVSNLGGGVLGVSSGPKANWR